MDGKQLTFVKRGKSLDFPILATSNRHFTKTGEESDPQRCALSTIVSLGRRHPNSWIPSWLRLSRRSFKAALAADKTIVLMKHAALPG
jgi:hypothetical protein